MNSHDLMCLASDGEPCHEHGTPSCPCDCQCELIQRVRLNTLNNKYHDDQIAWEQAYKVGYEDAMKDCNMTYEDFKKRNEEWREIMKAMGIERES